MAAPKAFDGLEMTSMGRNRPEKLAQDSTGEVETGPAWELSPRGSGDLAEDLRDGYTANDRRDMQRMGKKQEFRRNFRLISTIGFTTCVMGTWEILLASNTQGLTAGGLSGLFWSLCWSYTGQFFIVLSLADMASMAPTAGGQYHWVSEFAPPQYQKILSYLSGWLSAVSWQSIVALDAFLIGNIIQGLITLNDVSYTPERWQGTLLVFASVIGISLFNVFAAKHLPLAEGIFVTIHIFAFFPVIITLLVLAPKQSASAVFTQFTDNGAGWPSIALTVMVGQVSSMFVVLGSDSVAHMSEEIKDASIIVPKSMIWSFLINLPFSFGLLLTYLFCIGDVAEALASPTGYPFIYVFLNATGSVRAATGLTIVVLALLIMITISSLASTSRQTFAFARDNGLPFSNWLGAVHPTWHVPVNAVLFTCVFSMALALINIGSNVAFNAMLSLSTVALMATYVITIGCITLKRIRGEQLPYSRWSLGRYGLGINILALLYSCWSFFWSFWPNSHNITAENFNWACVLFLGLMSLSAVLYFCQARHVYEGPVVKVEGHKSS
ncbi:amino acid permease [Hirsutella rhossiliensis]|uniref:Amino acid permease domain-containing protein n=1 Tax=Hirsutella rhossiliensis TaxID=111463 RepID=A0A9P8N1Z1_9HYPO|nr:amino acid permease domain-containing protein [Hirsutella rhossiliensis]KAH0966163.1 amino acid permease domain-containing protein [Hirsutella rhossiliensis]